MTVLGGLDGQPAGDFLRDNGPVLRGWVGMDGCRLGHLVAACAVTSWTMLDALVNVDPGLLTEPDDLGRDALSLMDTELRVYAERLILKKNAEDGQQPRKRTL